MVSASAGFTQSGAGTLTVEISGPATNGTVAVTGNASLAGTLAIDLAAGVDPALGSSFTVMTFGSQTGVFDSVTGTAIGPGKQFTPNYTSGGLLLDVTP